MSDADTIRRMMDCMAREKGYCLGDGCYTMLACSHLTQDWRQARKIFDDFLRTKNVDRGLPDGRAAAAAVRRRRPQHDRATKTSSRRNRFFVLYCRAVKVRNPFFIKGCHDQYRLPAASSVRSTVSDLVDRNLIDRSAEGYRVYDRLFALWLGACARSSR